MRALRAWGRGRWEGGGAGSRPGPSTLGCRRLAQVQGLPQVEVGDRTRGGGWCRPQAAGFRRPPPSGMRRGARRPRWGGGARGAGEGGPTLPGPALLGGPAVTAADSPTSCFPRGDHSAKRKILSQRFKFRG